ncbi:MAG: galactose oxidase-like domain-containing protein [Chthoniobacterales bacterium]
MKKFLSRPLFLAQRRRLRSSAILVGATLSLCLFVHVGQAQSPATEGLWSTLPYEMPINPVHCGLLNTGKVLIAVRSESGGNQPSLAALWDPQGGTITVQTLLWDLFCSGMAALPDGRFLVVGGGKPAYGEYRSTVFDPATEKFTQVETMADGRWYATVTALGDGGLMTFSGRDEEGKINKAVELYHIGSGFSPEYVAPWTPPLYPRLHLLPNGDIFYPGKSSNLFTPATHTWTLNVARTVYASDRSYDGSVLLPLRPETGYTPRVFVMGGNSPATATAEVIDLSLPSPAWRMTASMSLPRIQMNAVLLPSGKVLALGGSAISKDVSTASLAADLFDPVTENWSSAGVGTYPRLYHSVALLMPDATVWVAGSNPSRDLYEKHMEIYSPAYLFATDGNGNAIPAIRPVIRDAPTEIGYGSAFRIRTPDAATIGSVVLARAGSTTHAFDMEQRLIGLSFNATASGKLTATAPPNGFIAPPGYYMLFILNQAGVPSVAKFVHLSSTPQDQPPKGTITAPAGDVTIRQGESVNFGGSATDPDGPVAAYSWIFPEGNPSTSSAQSPGLVKFDEAGTYVASLTALDGFGVNDPSPPTRTIIVQP